MQQVNNMNNGIYIEEDLKNATKTNFCIGVAGYPEKHFEAPNMESDLHYLKMKVDMGADYIVSQMFFDNEKFYAFEKSCREMGITVPIIPGLKPIYSKKQLTMLPKVFHIDLPAALSKEIMKCNTDEEVEQVGTEWLLHQSRELRKFGSPVLHYYTLGRPHIVANVVKDLL
jgi:methylenetetrahydrofolate reductase (NADPH)